jgi:hypothetical protein
MRARRLVTVAAVLTVAAGVGVAAVALSHQGGPPQPPPGRPAERVPTGPAAQVSLPSSPPTMLDIPRIGVHAALGSVGLDSSGAMEVPVAPHFDQPAWYRYSPTPGERGPTVIVGHVDSKHGPSVFFRLGALHTGDQVTVSRRDGSRVRFVVRDVRRFPKDHFPTALVYGDTVESELRLITCGGSFDRSTGHYRDNTVVFGSLD